MNSTMPDFPVLDCLMEFAQTKVYWFEYAIQLSHSLSLPLPSVFPRIFSNELALCISWSKYRNFSFNIRTSNEYSGLIFFRIDWSDLLAVQGTLKSLLHHPCLKPSILHCSAFFMMQHSHPYMTTGKTIALIRWTFVGKVMPLLFNMLSSLVIGFLPRSKCFNFMAAVTVCNDFGAPKLKSVTVSIVSPFICYKVMGLDAMILVFWMLSLTFSTLLFHFHQEAL